VTTNFCPDADGSVLFEMGNTRLICAAFASADVPDHAKARGNGWISAEYSLLPYSTSPRTKRRTGNPDGRSVEIQRLIGRSLRRMVDLSLMPGCAVTVDCDVLQAHGGTRTAAITGACIALRMAASRMVERGMAAVNPVVRSVAAVSAGYVGGELLLDLDYAEDSAADVDMNVVMDGDYNLVEVQGTGENSSYTMEQMLSMIKLARDGIEQLFSIQDQALGR